MITNFIILGLNIPNWILWVVGILVMVFLLFIDRRSTDKKELIEKEKLLKLEEEKRKNELEKELERGYCIPNIPIFGRDTLKIKSIINNELSVIWQIHEKATKDSLTISSSLPMKMGEDDLKNFQELLPEIISIKALNNHQLSFRKSPASNFEDIEERILKHIFRYLHRRYSWLNENIVVSLHYTQLDRLNCHFRKNTSDHIALGVMLTDIDGVINKQTTIVQMEENNSYQFDLIKHDHNDWEELLPKIKEVFKNYFVGGVEFIEPDKI